MMKSQNKKRGFTIIELVIVVSVIAILSAVLIPTFAGVIKRANLSADAQAVRQMNTNILASIDEDFSFEDAVVALDAEGYNSVDNLTPVSKGHAFYWDAENKTIVLVNEKDNNKVVYPENYKAEWKADWKKFDAKTVTPNLSNTDVANVSDLTAALENGAKKITLTKDLKMTDTVTVANEVVIDLNGKELNAAKNDSRPFNVDNGAKLTIDATGAEINVGKYGLVNIIADATATVVMNGGTYNANSKSENGAFIKVRKNATANITLNNVTYIDETNENYVVNSDLAFANLTVNGGSYKAKAGFQATASSTFTNVTIEATESYCVEVAMESTENNSVITGCTLKAPAAEWACLVVSGGASLEVSNCTIEATYAYAVLPTGGTIVATGNNNNAYATYAMNDGATASLTIDGVKKI